jgi:hypothetical protein
MIICAIMLAVRLVLSLHTFYLVIISRLGTSQFGRLNSHLTTQIPKAVPFLTEDEALKKTTRNAL